MNWARFAVLVCAAAILQAGLLGNWSIRPDLLLVLLVFFAVHFSGSDAIIYSFAIGFAADIITPVMGPHMIAFGLFGTLLAYLNRVIAIRTMPYQGGAIFTVGVLAGLAAAFLTALKTGSAGAQIYKDVFLTALYSAIVGPLLFLPSAWWMRIRTHRQRRYY